MNWSEQVDIYCERLGPGFWGEPVNAFTNLMFIAAALYVFPKIRGDRGAELLALSLFVIGICSGLFHTLATSWAGAADSISILIFILIYIYIAVKRVFHRPPLMAGLAVVAFFPFAAVTSFALLKVLGSLNGSYQYLPVLILIVLFGVFAPSKETRNGFFIGAGILTLSLTFRSIDQGICQSFPLGTHFLWHTCNGIMLGWMILVIHKTRSEVARSPLES